MLKKLETFQSFGQCPERADAIGQKLLKVWELWITNEHYSILGEYGNLLVKD
jgi:hypothetical protein